MRIRMVLIFFLFFLEETLMAQTGNREAGQVIVLQGNNRGVAACVACHGINGAGQPAAGFPQLAGLNAEYMFKQLQDFKSQKRLNPVMFPIAKGLTDQEMRNVSAYFSALPLVVQETSEVKPAVMENGKKIAEVGLWQKGVPACYSCHGPKGAGVGTVFPRISNQHKTYLIQQLNAWKNNQRKNDVNGLMKTLAQKLSSSEIEAVASYLENPK